VTGYILRRLGASVVLILLVLTITFLAVQLVPGDVLDSYERNPRISTEQRDRLRELYGLDRPVVVQYFAWLKAVLVDWDWGFSVPHGRPVTEVIARHLPPTFALAAAALLVGYPFGFSLGVLAARQRGRPLDLLIRVGSLTLYSIPSFWLGLVAILLLSNVWPIFPASHLESIDAVSLPAWERMLDRLHHLILPALVLGAPLAAEVARFVRNSLLEVMGQDYIRTARARGLDERRVVWVHGLRNALVPLIQIFGFSLPFILSGTFAIDYVFSWPGLGLMTWNAVTTQNYPLILATTAFTGALVISGNLLADLLHAAVDPRVRWG
jgi:peptide/nickel transport system permease protein